MCYEKVSYYIYIYIYIYFQQLEISLNNLMYEPTPNVTQITNLSRKGNNNNLNPFGKEGYYS